MKAFERVSLRTGWVFSLVGAVLLTGLLLGWLALVTARQGADEERSRRLADLAGAAALLVDPLAHDRITAPTDVQRPEYLSQKRALAALRSLSPDIREVFTLRWRTGEAQPRFVLDTGAVRPIGEAVSRVTSALRQAFQPPYQLHIESASESESSGSWPAAYAPLLRADGTLEGVVGLRLAGAPTSGALLVWLLTATFGVAALVSGLAWVLSRRLVRPLETLGRELAALRELEFGGAMAVPTRLAEVQTLNTRLEETKRSLRSLKKYLPGDLVAELIDLGQGAVLGLRRTEVTVFFCDLVNFTAASELLSLDELNELLTSYFELVTRVLEDHGAVVDKFIGDAVMAYWNAPKEAADHVWQGAQAALAVQRGLVALTAQWKRRGLPPLITRIGLNTGTVLAGNVGQADRLSYTILGKTVNLASRLESLNKYYGTRILAGESTLRALGDRVAWRPVDLVAVKGKIEGTLIGELADSNPEWWPTYRKAWDLYQAGEFEEALSAFDAVQTPEDPDAVSEALAARCRKFLAFGVPVDWTGTWVVQEK